MHEFRSCELLLPWRLKTNDLRDYLQVPRPLKRSWRYFLPVSSLFFFFMNFAICRLMTCLPLLWKNDQVDRKERIGCNCNVRFVTMRKKLNPTFSVRDLGFFLHSGRNLSFLSHQNNAKIKEKNWCKILKKIISKNIWIFMPKFDRWDIFYEFCPLCIFCGVVAIHHWILLLLCVKLFPQKIW